MTAGAGGSPPTRRCPATEDRAPATVATPSSADPTASRAVSWWSVHEHVAPVLDAAGSWPMAGTPAWRQLDDADPRKWAAICDAARHWALRVETCQEAMAQASRDVSAAARLARHRPRDRPTARRVHPAGGGGVMADIPYGTDYPDAPWIDRDGHVLIDDGGKPTQVHRGQARIAYRLAERYQDKLLHVAGIGWHSWDGRRWAADDRGEAKRAVLAELRQALSDSLNDKELRADVRKCESASGVAGVLDLAAALVPFAATVADLDSDPHLLNVANGTLDLHTLKLRPHAPADRITKICRGAYQSDTESPLWQAFLTRVLPDEGVRGFVQRLAGVGLLGTVREHVLAILIGVGANGKSVFDKAIRYALGDYACTAEPDLFMHRENAHPTGEMDLRGVRWVAVSESEKDRRLAESTIKRLTGGDTIRARKMRQDFVEFTPSHTPLLITNHLPRVPGDDTAIWRRIRVVPFEVVIPADEQDRELDARLQLEADSILSWAVAGWSDYQRIGLSQPDAVLAATSNYREDSDTIKRFIDDECVTSSPVLKATTTHLFEAWQRWRVQEGVPEISRKAFGQSLDTHGYPVTDKARDGRWRAGIAVRGADDFDD